MLIEHLGKCLEAAQDVFCRLNTINTHNGLLIKQGAHLLSGSFSGSALYNFALLDDRNGNGISVYLGSAPAPVNGSPAFHGIVFNFNPFKELLASFSVWKPRISLPTRPLKIAYAILLGKKFQ